MPRKAITAKISNEPGPAWAAQLTPREQRFVSEYIIDLNATEAGVRAGLGKTRKSSTEIASRLRRKHAVAQTVTVLIAQNSGATGSRIIEELGKLAFADVRGDERQPFLGANLGATRTAFVPRIGVFCARRNA